MINSFLQNYLKDNLKPFKLNQNLKRGERVDDI